MFVGRGIAVQAIGFLTSLALTRIFRPSDFGVTTLGLTIMSAVNVLADAGIAPTLVSRAEPPTRAEMASINGFQLLATGSVAVLALPLGFSVGGSGPATAIILFGLPMYAMRSRPLLLLEREMRFGPRIMIEIAELVAYAAFAVGLGVAGLGVWAMPVALVAKATTGTALVLLISPAMRQLEFSLAFAPLRPLLGFGLRFQLRGLFQLFANLVIVAIVGSVGGLTDLGYFGFMQRLLSIPTLAASSLAEVTFPAFSRLIQIKADVTGILHRATESVTVINALFLAPLAAASPGLLPIIFGKRWEAAAPLLPGSAVTLIVSGPTVGMLIAYLYAYGDARAPLRLVLISDGIAIVTTGILAHFGGLFGIGAGLAASQILSLPFLLRAVQSTGGPALLGVFVGPVIGACIAIGAGWSLCKAMHDSLVAGIAALGLASTIQLLALLITNRTGVVGTAKTLAPIVRSAVARTPRR